MTYLSELRSSLIDAAHREHASAEQDAPRHRPAGSSAPAARSARGPGRSGARWRGSLHGGRAILASVALGLTGTAVGVVQVGPPLGPEPQLSESLTQTVTAPAPGETRP